LWLNGCGLNPVSDLIIYIHNYLMQICFFINKKSCWYIWMHPCSSLSRKHFIFLSPPRLKQGPCPNEERNSNGDMWHSWYTKYFNGRIYLIKRFISVNFFYIKSTFGRSWGTSKLYRIKVFSATISSDHIGITTVFFLKITFLLWNSLFMVTFSS